MFCATVTLLVMVWYRRSFLLYFQKFINQLLFFFSQDYFPAIRFCLSHCNFWYIPRYVIGQFFFWLYVFFNLFSCLFFFLHADSLDIPPLLLALSVLWQTISWLWVDFNYFVLFPVAWILTIFSSCFLESVLLQWFCQVNSFLLLVCYSLTSHITKHNNCQTALSMFSTILPGVFHIPKILHETVLITC